MASDIRPLLSKKEMEYSLQESPPNGFLGQENINSHGKGRCFRVSRPRDTFSILAFLSILANVLLASLHFTAIKETCSNECPEAVSAVAGLRSHEIESTMIHNTVYSNHPDNNETLRDEMWTIINSDRALVLANGELIDRLGLEEGQDFPWDPSQKVYLVNAYHQLHCLKMLYWTITDAYRGTPLTFPYEHLIHCLDALRQDVICYADDELLFTTAKSAIPVGNGHVRKCRDFSKLEEWVLKPERNACYSFYGNSEPSLDHLSRWKHCPKDSPYFQKMREYFGYDENWEPDYEFYTGPTFPPLED